MTQRKTRLSAVGRKLAGSSKIEVRILHLKRNDHVFTRSQARSHSRVPALGSSRWLLVELYVLRIASIWRYWGHTDEVHTQPHLVPLTHNGFGFGSGPSDPNERFDTCISC